MKIAYIIVFKYISSTPLDSQQHRKDPTRTGLHVIVELDQPQYNYEHPIESRPIDTCDE
jgi:hypothetical protein